MDALIKKLKGPIVVLGGTGFIGGHLVGRLRAVRHDVVTGNRNDIYDCLIETKAQTVFNCAGCGNGGTIDDLMLSNVTFVQDALDIAFKNGCETFIHAGSATEYGDALVCPIEEHALRPSTAYGMSKAAASLLIWHYGKNLGKRVASLRFYNVYGPGDKETRLMSTIVREGKQCRLPPFGNPATAHDFIHVDDACRAFVLAAVKLKEEHYGESFNIGGDNRTLEEIAGYAGDIFMMEDEPVFNHDAPIVRWVATMDKAKRHLGYEVSISVEEGLKKLAMETK